MSKVKSVANNASALELQRPASGFIAALGELAQPFMAPAVPSDPVERMRAKFGANAEAAAKELRAGSEKGAWFRKLPDGQFVVCFRNANSAMTLNGTKQFEVADAESAAKLLDAAKAAAAAGELDEALRATQRKPPVRKKKNEQQPA